MFQTITARRVFSLAILLNFMFVACAFASGKPVRSFDIAAQSAASALNEFAKQADITLVFSYKLVSGKQTKPIKGDFAVADALTRMLDGTALSYRQVGENTVAIDSRNASKAEGAAPRVSAWAPDGDTITATPAGLRLAQVHATADDVDEKLPKSKERSSDKPKETEVVVTGSRIRSVVGEATVQPVYIYTSEDLERLGVQQMTDLNNYVPQLPTLAWESTPETGFTNLANQGGRVNFNGGLRNLGDTATLLLINGRRAPRLGAADGADSYDLSGIPISAVERVEILTDGASAVYGADAAAGVINVILKKRYSGTQFNAIYGNTIESDTGYTNLQLSTAYSTEKFSINLSGNWSKTNAFSPADRWFSASNDRRPLGGTDGRGSIPGGTGQVRAASGNLPGLDTNVAAIPAGSDGVNLTIADFANAGPIAEPFDAPKHTVYGDKGLESVRLNMEYEFTPWVTGFIEAGHSKQTSFRPGTVRTVSVLLPADYIGNPFDVPIRVQRAYWDILPYFGATFKTVNDSAVAGLRGPLPNNWRYEFAVQQQETDYSATGAGAYTTFGGTTTLLQAVNNPDPALRPILLNDGTTVQPNSDEVMRSLLVDRSYGELPETRTYDFKVDGPVWTLPAGEVSVAAGAEFREEAARFVIPENNDFGRLTSARERTALGLFAEAQVPVFSPQQDIPLAHRLSMNLSVRRDDYNDFGSKVVPRYGMLYNPVEWLALRASYGKGYKVPNLSSIYSPQTEGTVSIGERANVFDPMRGGENIFENVEPPGTGYVVTQHSGGNPDLRPELARNINVGILVDVPFVDGLSFGVDYYDIDQTDRIGGGLVDIIANFEERITRAPASAEDMARGYAGLITAVDVTPINIAGYRVTGFDYQMRYARDLGEFGSLNVHATVTKPKTGETKAAPNRDPVPNTPNSGYWRGTGMVSLTRGAWSIGSTTSYTSSYIGRYFPGGFYFNSRFENAPLTLVDANASYDFNIGNPVSGGWIGALVKDLRLSMNIYNVLGKDPPLNPASLTPVYTVDPRGRRYQISVQKGF